MNRLLHIAAAACLFAGAQALMGADADELPVRLTGISSIEGSKRALFEVPAKGRRSYFKPVLSEGERIEDLEVKRIEPATGRVHVRYKGTETSYAVDETSTQDSTRTLHFNAADSRQVLDLFQELSGRTVLMEPGLPGGKISLSKAAMSRKGAAAAIEDSFAELGIAMQARAEKFTFVIRTNKLDRLALIPKPPESSPKSATTQPANSDDILPAGMVKFQDADIVQVLEIYQELAGLKVLNRDRVGRIKITVKTQNEMTLQQAVWMMEALLQLADLAVERTDDKSVNLVSVSETGRTKRDAR